MEVAINDKALAALGDERLDWRFKGLPPQWSGRTPAQIRAERPNLVDSGPLSPLCVLDADAVQHNIATMARWCAAAGVHLAPHAKTHMAPQLFAMQLDAGACAITAATIGQVRICRAFGVQKVILANQLVDPAGLRWLATEFEADPDFGFTCWVDSVAGVALMTRELAAASSPRPVDVCVEVGMAGGRTGCRTRDEVDDVARAVADSPRLRLVGVAGYEAALGHQVTSDALAGVGGFLADMRAAVHRLAGLFESEVAMVTAGGSTYFDLVSDVLTGDWPGGLDVRTVLRSGAYVTHDHGLYEQTSPLTRDGAAGLRPAMTVWGQVGSVPEPGLAVVTIGRRDVSFDQNLPVPLGVGAAEVTRLNDQHAYLRLGAGDRIDVGSWLRFGISHPCTVFDKWQMIPMVDADGRVVDLIRTFF